MRRKKRTPPSSRHCFIINCTTARACVCTKTESEIIYIFSIAKHLKLEHPKVWLYKLRIATPLSFLPSFCTPRINFWTTVRFARSMRWTRCRLYYHHKDNVVKRSLSYVIVTRNRWSLFERYRPAQEKKKKKFPNHPGLLNKRINPEFCNIEKKSTHRGISPRISTRIFTEDGLRFPQKGGGGKTELSPPVIKSCRPVLEQLGGAFFY